MMLVLACYIALLPGFAKHGHVLTPGRYVGAEEVEDDAEPFAEKYPRLTEELRQHMEESERLHAQIWTALEGIGHDG